MEGDRGSAHLQSNISYFRIHVGISTCGNQEQHQARSQGGAVPPLNPSAPRSSKKYYISGTVEKVKFRAC